MRNLDKYSKISKIKVETNQINTSCILELNSLESDIFLLRFDIDNADVIQ